ncbi:MAG TPA: hypothetical protein VLS89_03850 [Candidatus Nanopelagicales bacterium]|nr:hypothetical protein [Candidatus Nanopelagicales bacterium]
MGRLAVRLRRTRPLGLCGALTPQAGAGPIDRVLAHAFWRRDGLAQGALAPVIPLVPSLLPCSRRT